MPATKKANIIKRFSSHKHEVLILTPEIIKRAVINADKEYLFFSKSSVINKKKLYEPSSRSIHK